MCFYNTTWMHKVKKGSLLFFGWLLVITPLLIRNFVLTGYIFFHTLPGAHFLFFGAIPIDMQVNNHNFHQSYAKVFTKEWQGRVEQKEKRIGL